MYKLNSEQINMVSGAALPPKYLRVPEFKKCLGTVHLGTANFFCMPDKKPGACPAESWKQLEKEEFFKRCGKK